MTEIRVQGDERLAFTLARAADRLDDLTVVNRPISNYTATRASAYAPKLSGRLAYSIQPVAERQAARISTDLVYAPVQENGWPGHGIRAHRFMARAAEEAEPEAVRAHLVNLNRIVDSIEGT